MMINRKNVIYTTVIMFMHLAFGANMNILGASLVDLRFIFNVPLETMSNVAVAQGIGYLIGALVGWSYKWLNRQLVLTLLLSLMAATIALVPHYPHLWIALLGLIVNGIGCGAWDASSVIWIVDMWPVGNAPLLQLLQFMYGCGSVVAPLVVAPYLNGEKLVDVKNNQTISVEDRIQYLSIPFTICGLSVAIVPITLFVLFFTKKYEKTSLLASTEISKSVTDIDQIENSRKIPYRKIKLAMCGLCLAAYATIELGWYGFSSAMFQSLPIAMSASEGAYMISLFSIALTLGRLITALITLKLPTDWILAYHYVITFAAILSIFLGRNSRTVIYFGAALLGFGYSAIWPGVQAFTERHLCLSNRICSLYSFLTGLMSLVIPLILGQTFNKHPLVLFLLVTLFCTLSFVMFACVKLWIVRDSRKSS